MSVFDRTFDVVVAGGGISGTMAALAAAREGRGTLLVERYTALGGMATLGLVQPITMWGKNGRYVVAGTGKKLLEGLSRRSSLAATPMTHYGPVCDSEYLKRELELAALEQNVSLLYHTWITGVEKDGNSITALRVLSKGGESAIRGRVFVDATGDADVAAFAGVPCATDSQGITLMMVVSGIDRDRCPGHEDMSRIYAEHNDANYGGLCMFWHPRRDTAHLNMTEVELLNALDPEDLTKATVECRRQAWRVLEIMQQHVAGFENAFISQTAPALGVRETRRIQGLYELTRDDVLEGTQFDDVVARCSCPLDIHGDSSEGRNTYTTLEQSYAIPYRSLVTDVVKNLVVAGRCISADHAAHSSLRRMAPGFAIGEAAGMAAAMTTDTGNAREVPVNELQEKLLGYGAVLSPDKENGD
jgi:hypothetical protein